MELGGVSRTSSICCSNENRSIACGKLAQLATLKPASVQKIQIIMRHTRLCFALRNIARNSSYVSSVPAFCMDSKNRSLNDETNEKTYNSPKLESRKERYTMVSKFADIAKGPKGKWQKSYFKNSLFVTCQTS